MPSSSFFQKARTFTLTCGSSKLSSEADSFELASTNDEQDFFDGEEDSSNDNQSEASFCFEASSDFGDQEDDDTDECCCGEYFLAEDSE